MRPTKIKKTLKIGSLLFAMASFAFAEEQTAFTLVKEGQPEAYIVVSENASPASQLAVKELQLAIKEITGATLPVVNNETASKFSRYIDIYTLA